VYANINALDQHTLEQLASAMEVSAADPRHRAMVETYLADLALPPQARVLEIGCGTGAIVRMLAARAEVREVVGLDPSPILLARARELGAGTAMVSFVQGDGNDLAFPDHSFDAVVLHRVLSHVPLPERVLAQAFRVLGVGGRLAVFDGDYATLTLATGELDPLELCVAAFAPAYITHPWLVRRLVELVRGSGFVVGALRSHGYTEVDNPTYLLSIVDRGADALVAAGRIGAELATALKAEARRRVETRSFYGHLAYASLTGRKASTSVSPPE
jgi:ubiquinone/menaquinone biosynthesis C-methylase UbiE